MLRQWQLYAIIIVGPFGVLLSQNAYQAGPLGAPAWATIVVTDPLAAIGVGLLWLDERVRTGTWELVGELRGSRRVPARSPAPHVRGAGR